MLMCRGAQSPYTQRAWCFYNYIHFGETIDLLLATTLSYSILTLEKNLGMLHRSSASECLLQQTPLLFWNIPTVLSNFRVWLEILIPDDQSQM